MQDMSALDQDLVARLRISEDALDQEIQSALDRVFNQSVQEQQLDYRGSTEEAIEQLFPAVDSLERVPALYVSETAVELNSNFEEQILNALKSESSYDEVIQRLQDPMTPSTWVRPKGIFKLAGHSLKIHRPHRDDEVD